MNNQSKAIVFIHGLFMNPVSWEPWIKFYEAKGYKCYAPAYPFHEGNPADLRNTIIPSSLNKKNFEAYKDKNSKTDFKEFAGRTHYICGQEGWEEVAEYIFQWISTTE